MTEELRKKLHLYSKKYGYLPSSIIDAAINKIEDSNIVDSKTVKTMFDNEMRNYIRLTYRKDKKNLFEDLDKFISDNNILKDEFLSITSKLVKCIGVISESEENELYSFISNIFSKYNDFDVVENRHIKENALSNDQSVLLFHMIKNGDRNAKTYLIIKNFGMVHKIANKFQNNFSNDCAFSPEDLFQEGILGLENAISMFDPSIAAFSTYAYHWVSGKIYNFINNNKFSVRVSDTKTQKFTKIDKIIEQLYKQNGMVPTIDEIVSESGFSIKDVNDYYLLSTPSTSLYTNPTSMGKDYREDITNELIDFIEDDFDLEGECIDKINGETLDNLLSSILKPKKAEIIRASFGLGSSEEDLSLAAVGRNFSLTRERVRQIVEDSFEKIRANSAFISNFCSSDEERHQLSLISICSDKEFNYIKLSGGLFGFEKCSDEDIKKSMRLSAAEFNKVKYNSLHVLLSNSDYSDFFEKVTGVKISSLEDKEEVLLLLEQICNSYESLPKKKKVDSLNVINTDMLGEEIKVLTSSCDAIFEKRKEKKLV